MVMSNGKHVGMLECYIDVSVECVAPWSSPLLHEYFPARGILLWYTKGVVVVDVCDGHTAFKAV
jgi:hypothetical protein